VQRTARGPSRVAVWCRRKHATVSAATGRADQLHESTRKIPEAARLPRGGRARGEGGEALLSGRSLSEWAAVTSPPLLCWGGCS
jgi:hypothetical protein